VDEISLEGIRPVKIFRIVKAKFDAPTSLRRVM
jgi:hypothetical protein